MAVIIDINSEQEDTLVSKTINTLESGGVILYPTDTVYGLGVDATNIQAVQKLFYIKGRDYNKPFSIAVSSVEMLSKYAQIDMRVEKIINAFLPGPLTLVLPRTDKLPTEVVSGRENIGIRIPHHPTLLNIIKVFGKPVITTSANKSGEEPHANPQDIIASIPEIDLVLTQGVLPEHTPSTVVDLTQKDITILREGEISQKDIESVL